MVAVTNSEAYTDSRRRHWLTQPFLPLLPTISCFLAGWLAIPALYWTTVVFWFGLIALLDQVTPKDANNPPESVLDNIEEDNYYVRILIFSIPFYIVNFIGVCWYVSNHSLSFSSYIGIAVSMGIVSGLALAVGHEFGHKTSRSNRRFGKLMLSIGGVGQFLIGHLKGHHVDVATPKDFASSQMGQTLYQFGMRSQSNFFKKSWEFEKDRLLKKGTSAWSLQNETLQQYLGTGFLFGSLTYAFGWIVLPLLVLQMYVCWWYLTLIEYCQHYGLKRKQRHDGSYELSGMKHSWNTNMLFSNNLLLNFVRHSGHHIRSTRWYQALRATEPTEAPVLPYCYSLMFMAAMLPPLFFSIMDKRVVEWADGDLEKINIFPPAKERIVKKYGEQSETSL